MQGSYSHWEGIALQRDGNEMSIVEWPLPCNVGGTTCNNGLRIAEKGGNLITCSCRLFGNCAEIVLFISS